MQKSDNFSIWMASLKRDKVSCLVETMANLK